jgi:hypothetical protein
VRHLIDVADDPSFAGFVEAVAPAYGVQGVVIDIDPLWSALWELHRMGLPRSELSIGFGRELATSGAFASNAPWAVLRPSWIAALDFISWDNAEQDLEWLPDAWRAYAELSQRPGHDPRRLVVVLRPSLPRGQRDEVAEIARAVGEQMPFGRAAESRPVAQLRATYAPLEGGRTIHADIAGLPAAGTLGGFLSDASGTTFATTCGHVAPLGVSVYRSARLSPSAFIGTTIHSSRPSPLAIGSLCNRYSASQCDIDFALIAVDQALARRRSIQHIGAITRIKPEREIGCGQPVRLSGAARGLRRSYIGGLAAVYLMADADGNRYCYQNLIELRRRPSWLPLTLCGDSAAVVASGDSGAWVVADGQNGPECLGVVVGSDIDLAYGCYMERAVTQAQTSLGLPLTI